MARILAIEWDDHEARVVVGNVRSSDLAVEHAFAVPLESDPTDTESLGSPLAEALASRGLSKLESIVVLGRNAVELRVLTLPPAAKEDLPDMVRFQAQKEFSSLSADSPLDFVELAHGDADVTVLAAATPRRTIEQVAQLARRWEGEAIHIVLRPFAAASLWLRSHPDAESKTVMLIDVVETDADLTVLVDGHVTFLRTVRLPQQADASGKARALLGEVRRTMVAARSQTGGRRVDQVVWIGAPSDGEEILKSLGESLEQPVEAFEPFSAVTVGRKLKSEPLDTPGHFAPLLGALLDHAHAQAHTIDFLHPRKRPAPPDQRRKRIGYGIAAAAAILLISGAIFGRLWMLDAQIAELEAELSSRQTILKKSSELIDKREKLDEFARQDVTWLDEIVSASERIPPADDVILRSLLVSLYKEPGGRMFLKGYVRSPEMIRTLEDSLRYGKNDVNGRRGIYDPGQRDYNWSFDVTVTVPPDRLDGGHSLGRQYLQDTAKHPPAQQAPTSDPVAEAESTTDTKAVSVSTPDSTGTQDPASADETTDTSPADSKSDPQK